MSLRKMTSVLAPLLFLQACATVPAQAPVARQPSAAGSPGIVSAADPRAAAAGVEILREGGNATDAAIATMLALNVVEPQNSGIGGGLFWVRHDGKGGGIETIDGRETAPRAATPDWFLGPDGKPLPGREGFVGGKSAGVPGAVAAMAEAHKRHGKLAWARLFEPAIRLARDGFEVTARLHNGPDRFGQGIAGPARDAYLPNGQPPAIGETLRLPLLAATLEKLARQGPDAFYRGDNPRKIAAALDTAAVGPSSMTAADVERYQAKERPPVCGTYRRYRICGMGPPSSGGITVLMILKQLERFDMGRLGRASPTAWHLFAESERLAYADRDAYIADPGFVSVPVAGLLDEKYLASRSALIDPQHTLASYEPGHPAGAPPKVAAVPQNDRGTTDLAVADAAGNVVEVTTTINGYFGSGVSVDGYFLNNEMPDFDRVPVKDGYLTVNRVQGGKRPRSSMAPTIVYGPGGEVRAAIGAAGGATIIAQVAKALVGMIDWHMSAQDAIAMGLLYAPSKGGTLEQGTELEALAPQLQALGETLRTAPLGLKANAIERVDGRWIGAADPRSEGVAMDTAGNVTQIERRTDGLNRPPE